MGQDPSLSGGKSKEKKAPCESEGGNALKVKVELDLARALFKSEGGNGFKVKVKKGTQCKLST